jgi:hypothetical protein
MQPVAKSSKHTIITPEEAHELEQLFKQLGASFQQQIISEAAGNYPFKGRRPFSRTDIPRLMEAIARRDEQVGIKKREQGGRQVTRVKEVLLELFPPEGRAPEQMTLKAIWKAVCDKFRERKWKLASRDSVARAIGRRR